LRTLNNVSLPTLRLALINSSSSDLTSLRTPSLGRDLRLFLTISIICCSNFKRLSALRLYLYSASRLSPKQLVMVVKEANPLDFSLALIKALYLAFFLVRQRICILDLRQLLPGRSPVPWHP